MIRFAWEVESRTSQSDRLSECSRYILQDLRLSHYRDNSRDHQLPWLWLVVLPGNSSVRNLNGNLMTLIYDILVNCSIRARIWSNMVASRNGDVTKK
jgi:hypothetical protein